MEQSEKPTEFRPGYCGICGVRTWVCTYPAEPLSSVCENCYEVWKESDFDALFDPALEEGTVAEMKFEMLRRRNRIALQIDEAMSRGKR